MFDFNNEVIYAVNSLEFEKISDLTKEQFTNMLSNTINTVLNSNEFQQLVYEKVSEENKIMKIRSNGQSNIF